MKLASFGIILLPAFAAAQPVEFAQVIAKGVEHTIRIPGELLPYERVDLHARVTGYVEKVLVDRGSAVKQGQLLVALVAPEMKAQVAEADAKVKSVEAQIAETRAGIVAAESTYNRLLQASETQGAIAGNELVLARQAVEAARASLAAHESARDAARASAAALRDLESYLNVRAPFSGVITERYVHPGALVGPASGPRGEPLLRLEKLSQLRLVVAVPESAVAGFRARAHVEFQVQPYPERRFSGTIARVPRSMDPKTRTMAVELDVANSHGLLAPGMYPDVSWPVKSRGAVLLVPRTAVVTTTERTFVIRAARGAAEWVTVRRGLASGDLVEVYGPLEPGDLVVKRGSDEIREGSPLK